MPQNRCWIVNVSNTVARSCDFPYRFNATVFGIFTLIQHLFRGLSEAWAKKRCWINVNVPKMSLMYLYGFSVLILHMHIYVVIA